ncbi:hypothetical protein ISN44_As08g012960 [Arabidopsis suecica]|uniref:Uncharacterized protein n=1 Tax=Arabidopsis suecica TaxID=45249 RepID=A0A8T2B349_ARASU|nr:hypothetical protein ISN44_As08g012960 [Arabidopsis suecica]
MMKARSQSISLRGFFVSSFVSSLGIDLFFGCCVVSWRCQVAGVSRRNYNEIATSWCIQMDSIQYSNILDRRLMESPANSKGV